MNSIKLIVKTNKHKYPIIIGKGVANKLAQIIDINKIKYKKSLLVIDTRTPKILVKKIVNSFLKKR